MSLWICDKCGAAYSVDAPLCPQCGASGHHDDFDEQWVPLDEALPLTTAATPVPEQEPAAAVPAPPFDASTTEE